LLLDVSETMKGEPIEALNNGLFLFVNALRGEPQALETVCLSVITFGNIAKQIVLLTDLVSFQVPQFSAGGYRVLGAALELLDERLEVEVKKPTRDEKGDWKPIIFLFTDGIPSDNWQNGAGKIKKQDVTVVACAAGFNADLNLLKQITENVIELKSASKYDISKYFRWETQNLLESKMLLQETETGTQEGFTDMKSLQDQIKKTSKDGILELPYGGEFHEKLVIKKPITIRSITSPITIVGASPTITIQKKSVVFENINVVSSDEKNICLSIKKGINPKFNNVFVKGRVEGLEGEEGHWEIPDVLELPIEPNKVNKKKIIIRCPVPAKIYPEDIAVVSCNPSELNSGINEIEITTHEILKDTLVTGDFVIETLKYKLKRRISLTGNTFDLKHVATVHDEEYLWVCQSAKSTINANILKQLPEGDQGVPYQFVLDEDALKSKGYNIQVDGLPNGLRLNKSALFPKIEGTTKKFGEFEVTFVFCKDNVEYKFPSKLQINEKIIVPLKIKPLPDPIEAIEEKMISIKFDILSSNSSKITLQTEKDLPKGLQLDESTRKICGKIAHHGMYNTIVRIKDDTNELRQTVNLFVKPKDPLKLKIEKTYTFYKNEEFRIPITIDDATRLVPKLQVGSQPPGQIKLQSEEGRHCLIGRLTEPITYDVKIKIEDIYNRHVNKTILIQCIEKPIYTVTWSPDSPIIVKGCKLDAFSEQINAKIRENRRLKPKYSCVGRLPSNYTLTKNGCLTGKIDGEHHLIKIRAEVSDWYSDKEFEVITNFGSTKIVTFRDPIPEESIFHMGTKKVDNNKSEQIAIRKELKKGRINENYKESLLAKEIYIPQHVTFAVSRLPEGLRYNPNNFSIEGIPKKEGVYRIEVSNPVDNSTTKMNMEITTSLFHYETTNQAEKPREKKKDRKAKFEIGEAFKAFQKSR